MRITEKILLLFLPIFMLAVVAMTLFTRRAAEQVLIEDVGRNASVLSLSLVESYQLAEAFDAVDGGQLLVTLLRVEETVGAAYAVALGPDGQALARTAPEPAGETGASESRDAQAAAAATPQRWELTVEDDRFLEISVPVWSATARVDDDEASITPMPHRLGTIRMGLSLSRPLGAAQRISRQVLWIVTLVSVIVMTISLFYIRRVLLPVRWMAAATERLASGELGETIPVQSRDEVGEMAHSFNRMSQELAATTVSAAFHDSILDNMRDVLVVTNTDGSVRRANRAALALLDYTEGDLIGRSASHLFASGGDNPFGADGILSLSRGSEVDGRETGMVTKAGAVIPVLISIASYADRSDNPRGFIVTATDITERKRSEVHIRQSLQEKEVLLKEIHHRVKNNLQIISSLLNLQSLSVGDRQILALFSDSQTRVQTMALIHEKLYQSQDLARIDFRDYLESLVNSLYESYREPGQAVGVDVEVVDQVLLGVDQAIPCGLIVNELVSNSLKHAFPNGAGGRVVVRFARQTDDTFRLEVSDDGCGLPPAVDLERQESLGLKLVQVLVGQMHGRIEVEPQAPGTAFQIDFRAERQARAETTRGDADVLVG